MVQPFKSWVLIASASNGWQERPPVAAGIARKGHLVQGPPSPGRRAHANCQDCLQHLHHMLSPAHRSLKCPFYNLGNSREDRWQYPAMEQASEANCTFISSSPLLIRSESICVGIWKDLGVISQTS